MYENHLEEVQGAATSSVFLPPLFQDVAVCTARMQSAMLNASGTCPLTKPNLQHMQQNDRVVIRQICNVKLQDIVTIRSNEVLALLGIEDMYLILKERRLQWYEHVECSKYAVKTLICHANCLLTGKN